MTDDVGHAADQVRAHDPDAKEHAGHENAG